MSKNITREITVYTGRKRPKKKEASPPPVREAAPGTPTPERLSKESTKLATTEVKSGNVYKEAEVAHKIREPVEVYRKHFTNEEVQAAEDFCRDAHALFFSASVTANYDSDVKSVPGPRSGGVTDRNRDAYLRFKSVLERVTPGDRKALLALVLNLRSEMTGKATSMHEFASIRGTEYATKEDLAKVGLGLLKAALEHTHEAYRDHRTNTDRANNHSRVRPQLKGPRKS